MGPYGLAMMWNGFMRAGPENRRRGDLPNAEPTSLTRGGALIQDFVRLVKPIQSAQFRGVAQMSWRETERQQQARNGNERIMSSCSRALASSDELFRYCMESINVSSNCD